jgi:uncharacterized caspase-like protein
MSTFTRRAVAAFPLAAAAPAFAQSRAKFALIVANSDYDGDGKVDTSDEARFRAQERGYVGDLANPWFDGVRVGDALKRAGFSVETVLNADRGALAGAIMRFYARAQAAGPATSTVLYFAGHGIQIGGRNYLVATGARLIADEMPSASNSDQTRIALAIGAPVQEALMRVPRVTEAPGYHLMLLDACRDNPWEPQIRAAYAAKGQNYVGERGFIGMTVLSPRTVVSFSAQPGQVAVDGPAAAGSPYASAIAAALGQPGATVDGVLDSIAGVVTVAAAGQQSPWVRGRLGDGTPV